MVEQNISNESDVFKTMNIYDLKTILKILSDKRVVRLINSYAKKIMNDRKKTQWSAPVEALILSHGLACTFNADADENIFAQYTTVFVELMTMAFCALSGNSFKKALRILVESLLNDYKKVAAVDLSSDDDEGEDLNFGILEEKRDDNDKRTQYIG